MLPVLVHCTAVNAFKGTVNLKPLFSGQYLKFKPQRPSLVKTLSISHSIWHQIIELCEKLIEKNFQESGHGLIFKLPSQHFREGMRKAMRTCQDRQ
jgi:hypothetical protein